MVKHHSSNKQKTRIIHRNNTNCSQNKQYKKPNIKSYFHVIYAASHYTASHSESNGTGMMLAKSIIHVILSMLELLVYVPCVSFLLAAILKNEQRATSFLLFLVTAFCSPIIWSSIRITRIDMEANDDKERVSSFLGNLIAIVSLLASLLLRR